MCVFFCISVLAFSGVFLFPTRVFLFWGLGFRFGLRVSVLSLLLSAFEFCELSVSCSIEYTRRRFESKSPRANGLMRESHTAKYDNLSCKICTGYTISIYRSTRVSSTSFSPQFRINRPFYRYGRHIEFISFKEYYGMPRGHEHDPIYSLSIYARFSGQFFYKFS